MLIDLANHRPSFMPYKAVVLALEFSKREREMASRSGTSGYSDDPRPRKWKWRFVN